MILAFSVSIQIVIIGALTGLAYAVLATGIVLVYRATRVINFAHAQVGALCGALLAELVIDTGWPYVPAFVLMALVGGVIGGLTEVLVIRRLFASPRLIVLVATIGVAQILLFVELAFVRIESNELYPTPIDRSLEIGALRLLGQHFMLIAFVPAIVVGLSMFLNRTPFGVAIRGVADDADLARLHGISARRVSTTVWVIAGVLAAVTAILLNPVRGTVPGAASAALGPALLLRALAAALVGRMASLPRTLVGGLAIGVAEALLIANYGPSEVDLVLLVAVLALVYLFSRRSSEPDVALSVRVPPIPERLRAIGWVRNLGLICATGSFAIACTLPLAFDRQSQIFLFSRVAVFAVIGVSLTVLTGWAGQLSLGQYAFVAVGAFTTFALTDRGVPFGIAGLWSVVAGVVLAIGVGLPALRIRGLFLAVTTLAFAVAMSTWGLTREWLVGARPVVIVDRPELGPIDFSNQTTYYYLCLAVLAAVVAVVAHLRRTGAGRALVATRDNQDAAAAYSVSPTRAKLSAFALSGGIAALAGWLLAGLLPAFDEQIFGPEESLRVASMAIIGGISTVSGAVLGAVWVVGLPALFPDVRGITLATSGVGLLVLILYLPGGLAGGLVRVRGALLAWLDPRIGQQLARPDSTASATTMTAVPRPPEAANALEVRDLTVRFGGLTAVNGVSIDVPAGTTVGLIGANGAGKSTLMNAISGFLPHDGDVRLFGTSLRGLDPHDRARAGIARSFQDARLFDNLTVRESIEVALERFEASELVPSMLGLRSSRRAELAKLARADELIGLLGLGRYADTFIAELSTGTRRIVELAGLLALDAPLLLLDEPTAGIAQREVEAFGPLLGVIRAELGATMLLIEHDMGLIMSMSDHVYCMEAGTVIASGPPAEVRTDARVIASYLGTDERAIVRSDAGRARPEIIDA